MTAKEWLVLIQQAADYNPKMTPLIEKYGEMLLQEVQLQPVADEEIEDEAENYVAEQAKKLIKVCEQISNDAENDAKEFDGKPFNGKIVAAYFGNHGAAINALANVLKEVLERQAAQLQPVADKEIEDKAKNYADEYWKGDHYGAARVGFIAGFKAALQYKPVPDVEVLKHAVGIIKQWHNIQGYVSRISEKEIEQVWDIYYNNAPEMKIIREALKVSHAAQWHRETHPGKRNLFA